LDICILIDIIYLACQTEMLPLRENQIILLILVEFGGRDRMVVGFTTTYAISTYHH
jgi:hypothetical protein